MTATMQADGVLAFHAAYVLFNLFVPIVVATGAGFGWLWVRNSWLRNIHLATLGIPVVEAINRWSCPLTRWERDLRSAESASAATLTWMQHAADWIVYTDLDPTVWRIGCVLFGVATLALYILVPPNWPGRWWTSTEGRPSLEIPVRRA